MASVCNAKTKGPHKNDQRPGPIERPNKKCAASNHENAANQAGCGVAGARDSAQRSPVPLHLSESLHTDGVEERHNPRAREGGEHRTRNARNWACRKCKHPDGGGEDRDAECCDAAEGGVAKVSPDGRRSKREDRVDRAHEPDRLERDAAIAEDD